MTADRERQMELTRRLRALPAVADPRRPSVCPEAPGEQQEEGWLSRYRSLSRQGKFPECERLLVGIPQREVTLFLMRARAENLYVHSDRTGDRTLYRKMLKLLPLSGMLQADRTWLMRTGMALYGLRERAGPDARHLAARGAG